VAELCAGALSILVDLAAGQLVMAAIISIGAIAHAAISAEPVPPNRSLGAVRSPRKTGDLRRSDSASRGRGGHP
jgi:hypothetical protein